VHVEVAVQYRVVATMAYEAFYRLTDPRGQIQSYVFDVVRSTVPKMELDEAFVSKNDIAMAVLRSLQHDMKDYGYVIKNTLVTDLNPDKKVKASMNQINAARRLKEAAMHKAEANKTKQVKAAEAEAEARYLSGLGVARQRTALIEGLQTSVTEFSGQIEDVTPKDVMDILLLSQYFDTLSHIGGNELFLEHDPSTVARLQHSLGDSFLQHVGTRRYNAKNRLGGNNISNSNNSNTGGIIGSSMIDSSQSTEAPQGEITRSSAEC
jgi:SPFH domain / Band 7 family